MNTEGSVGRRFAEAIAAKDFDQVKALVAPDVDFRGLTPGRAWEASSADDLAGEVLNSWFEEDDHLDELIAVETGMFADRHQVTYSLCGHNEEGPFVVEQQAYFTESNGRIDWMRVLCSGFRPA